MRLPGEHPDWIVTRWIGGGGQGAVWELRSQSSDEVLALKWYRREAATLPQREVIRLLVERGAPDRTFLWPQDIVDAPDGTFGYTMPLRPPEYRGIVDLLTGRADAPPSLVLALGTQLASAFLQLHAEGLCYRDINFGNVFFEPATGQILVCDNDNVGIDGASYSGVLGTRLFMAPEIVRGDAMPSAATDLHSLAVLVFYLTMVHHPLLGRRESSHRTREGQNRLLGSDPLFVFDPADDANRPDPLTQPAPLARWTRYPRAIQLLFEQAFGPGLHDPDRRVRESVWRGAFARTRDQIVVCPSCLTEGFVGGTTGSCVACHRPFDPFVRLAGPHGEVVLNAGTTVHRHHVARDFDIATVLGRVVHDPVRDRWGLRNESDASWVLTLDGRPDAVVEPGRTVALVRDATVVIEGARFRVVADA